MEQAEKSQASIDASTSGDKSPLQVASATRPPLTSPAPEPCPTCGALPATNGGVVPPAIDGGPAASPSYVYAIGTIEPKFPRLSVEKELAQVKAQAETAGLTDRQALQKVLSERRNRYLARQLCWVLTIEGLETYLLYPRDHSDWELLIEAVRAEPSPMDVDVVIGIRG